MERERGRRGRGRRERRSRGRARARARARRRARPKNRENLQRRRPSLPVRSAPATWENQSEIRQHKMRKDHRKQAQKQPLLASYRCSGAKVVTQKSLVRVRRGSVQGSCSLHAPGKLSRRVQTIDLDDGRYGCFCNESTSFNCAIGYY